MRKEKENNNILAQFGIKLRQYLIRWWQFMTRRIILLEKTKNTTGVLTDGTKVWKNRNGELHREDGLPAIEYISGNRDWYFNGKIFFQFKPNPNGIVHISNMEIYNFYTSKWTIPEEFCPYKLPITVGEFNELIPTEVTEDGTRIWKKIIKGKEVLHRGYDKPAIIYSNGQMEFYENGNKILKK